MNRLTLERLRNLWGHLSWPQNTLHSPDTLALSPRQILFVNLLPRTASLEQANQLPLKAQVKNQVFPKEGLNFLSNWEENIAAKILVHLEDLITDKSMLNNLYSSVHIYETRTRIGGRRNYCFASKCLLPIDKWPKTPYLFSSYSRFAKFKEENNTHSSVDKNKMPGFLSVILGFIGRKIYLIVFLSIELLKPWEFTECWEQWRCFGYVMRQFLASI